MTLSPRVLHSVPIATGAEGARLRRADIEVAGLDQAGASFELRMFLNNPGADAATEPTEANGYAGSIYVYGYGRPPESMRDDPRLPMTRSIIATEAVARARAEGPTASLTLVAVPADSPGPEIDLGSVDVAVLVDEQPPEA